MDRTDRLDRLPALTARIATAVRRRGGDCAQPVFGFPADDAAIGGLTAHAGPVPAGLEQLLRRWSSASLAWQLQDDQGQRRWGGLSWSLPDIVAAEQYRSSCVQQGYFEDGSDAATANPNAAAIWHDAFAWLQLRNGDCLAVDPQAPDGPVRYLSHDGHPLHGATLGASISDFLHHWALLGCPGPEAWQLEPFIGPGGIDPEAQEARAWRRWLRLG